MILEVFQLQVRGDIPTGSYLVGDGATQRVAWVDPATYSDEVVAMIQERRWKLECILLTHGHYDHTGGIERAMKDFRCPLYAHPADTPEVGGDVRSVRHGQSLSLGSLTVDVYETPGHTPGSVTYHVGEYLFVGDALFAGSVGGTGDRKLFELQRNALRQKILPLGDHLIVCPGHGPMSTVGLERLHNPFLGH